MATKTEERRIVIGELRAVAAEGGSVKIVGHAAKFDQLSEDLGGFRERIAPGAFAKTIQSADIRALWNHDANIVLGRNKSGTLRLSEDSAGLAYEVDSPDTQLVRDMVLAPISRGDVNQCSFGFRPSATNGSRSTANGYAPCSKSTSSTYLQSPTRHTSKPKWHCAA